MSTSQQAGINGVKDEAISLSGQLLVGGSSLMYLKSLHDSRHHFIKMHPSTKTFFQKVNLRTNGFVIFFLTAQAVGFQTYTGEMYAPVSYQPSVEVCLNSYCANWTHL